MTPWAVAQGYCRYYRVLTQHPEVSAADATNLIDPAGPISFAFYKELKSVLQKEMSANQTLAKDFQKEAIRVVKLWEVQFKGCIEKSTKQGTNEWEEGRRKLF